MGNFEIEIKSLLGEKEKADQLRNKLFSLPVPARLIQTGAQLNHYFLVGDWNILLPRIEKYLKSASFEELRKVVKQGSKHSVRTREVNGRVFFVVKASVDETSSSNGISRMEFEDEVGNLSLDELDSLLVSSGFSFQAKWSREREEYDAGDVTICIDRNAGYGYVAEFEKVIQNETEIEATRAKLLEFMSDLGVEELPQERLERMFAFYNEHWPEYYGTDRIFVLE